MNTHVPNDHPLIKHEAIVETGCSENNRITICIQDSRREPTACFDIAEPISDSPEERMTLCAKEQGSLQK